MRFVFYINVNNMTATMAEAYIEQMRKKSMDFFFPYPVLYVPVRDNQPTSIQPIYDTKESP